MSGEGVGRDPWNVVDDWRGQEGRRENVLMFVEALLSLKLESVAMKLPHPFEILQQRRRYFKQRTDGYQHV